MKERGRVVLLLLGGLLLAGVRVAAADPILEQLQKQWEATRNQLTTIAAAIPEGKYDYKPTPEVRSFREQLQHLTGENYMFMGFVSGEKQDPGRFAALKTKAELIKALSENYAY